MRCVVFFLQKSTAKKGPDIFKCCIKNKRHRNAMIALGFRCCFVVVLGLFDVVVFRLMYSTFEVVPVSKFPCPKSIVLFISMSCHLD